METYNGHVRTPTDAIILFEACRLGLLPRVQRRLSEKERQSIRSGSVFVWDEREAGMRRWTDGKSWSASRVSGSFLTYREMEGKRGGSSFVTPARGAKTPESARNSAEDGNDGEEGPDGYRYKPDGLMKQSFSITTNQGQHLHLISYYSRGNPTAPSLRQPTTDPNLASIQIPPGMYPESSVNDQSNTPAVTRSPMPGAPNYVMAPNATYGRQPPPPPPYPYYPGYMPHPGYAYPLSPMHTPPGYPAYPYHHPPPSAHSHPHALPPPGHPGSPYGPPPPPPLNQAPPHAYDQRPLRASHAESPGAPSQPAADHPPTQPPGITQPAPVSPTRRVTESFSTEHAPAVPQIDPRLTETASALATATAKGPVPLADESKPPSGTPDKVMSPMPRMASQAPSLEALMNGSASAAPVRSPAPPPSAASGRSPMSGEKQDERESSRSPGGTHHTVPPQDIPSEKLGFREDMRALSKLDRVFARV